jgi:3-oxoacyl-[acyl-carrier-protein] synthase II
MSLEIPVVITGIGVISPLGLSPDSYWDALLQGKSGVREREEFAGLRQPFRIAAPVADFEPKKYVRPRKALKVMCRPIQFGFAASTMAVQDAGIEGQIDPDRLCTVFGTEAFYADPHEVARVFRKCIVNRCYDHDRWGEYAMREIEPLWMLKYLPNMVASHISIACDARGPSNTICQAEASSLLAIIEATDLIQRGVADAVVAGGTGSMMSTTGMIYRGLKKLSMRVDDPPAASRPFDVGRDGMVVGEGSGAFVLEREDFALARGARPLARVLDFCRSFHPPGQGFGEAVYRNLVEVLQRSGLQAEEVGHVNAHGFSTIEDDVHEARGIHQALGDVPVIAPKSSFGNLGPGTGSVELAASVKAFQKGLLPASLNVDQLDERCPINLVTSPGVSAEKQTAVKLNFTEAGQIASLMIAG